MVIDTTGGTRPAEHPHAGQDCDHFPDRHAVDECRFHRLAGACRAGAIYGLAACLNAALLYRGMRSHGVYTPQAGWLGFTLKLLVAMEAMAALLWWGSGADADWLGYAISERLLRLALLVVLGAGTYFATLWVLGFRLSDFRRRGAA